MTEQQKLEKEATEFLRKHQIDENGQPLVKGKRKRKFDLMQIAVLTPCGKQTKPYYKNR